MHSTRGIASAVAAAIALLASANPASASTYNNGCTVSPKKPIITGLDTQGRKVVDFPISIECGGDRSAIIEQQAYDQDNGKPGDVGGDDLFYTANWRWNFGASGGLKTLYPTYYVPDLDSDPAVEIYHRVRFKVCSANDVCGAWTPWEKSTILAVNV